MFKTSIKKHNVKAVEEPTYHVEELPTKWEVLETFDSFGNAQYSQTDLVMAMEQGKILAFKVEWFND